MNNLPDYSEYLKRPGRFNITEHDWLANPGKHDFHAKIVNDLIEKQKIKSIIEIGCGTGETAKRLKGFNSYTGIDSNEDCIDCAIKKTNQRFYAFIKEDIRTVAFLPGDGLVICFSTLKHFGLHEWFDVFKKISSFGKYFIFDMQVAEQTKDDGIDFPHVWKNVEELKADIANAGLVLLGMDDSFNPLEPVFICREK